MTILHKSVVLDYTAAQMYALVEDMESYPAFLPWCDNIYVQRDMTANTALATISVNFCGIRQYFTTRNTNSPPNSISMTLVRGPFSKLDGQWTFTALNDRQCRVELYLNYNFSNFFLEKLVGSVFDIISNSLVDSFCERAKKYIDKNGTQNTAYSDSDLLRRT